MLAKLGRYVVHYGQGYCLLRCTRFDHGTFVGKEVGYYAHIVDDLIGRIGAAPGPVQQELVCELAEWYCRGISLCECYGHKSNCWCDIIVQDTNTH